MRARGGGRIANIASVGGIASDNASKLALVGLSQDVQSELARDRIVVSTIAPGLMRPDKPRSAASKGEHEYSWFALSDSLPLLSVSAGKAARRIVRALELGKPHVVIGLPARVAALANGVAPGLVSRALTLANHMLPDSHDPRDERDAPRASGWMPKPPSNPVDQAAARNQ
jgi:NAD(P)-dependent dehydrogenase (short-subunit alcohol dehydrogenase family)